MTAHSDKAPAFVTVPKEATERLRPTLERIFGGGGDNYVTPEQAGAMWADLLAAAGARELDATYRLRINSGETDNATPPAQAAGSVQVAYSSGETLSKQAVEAVLAKVANAIAREDSGYSADELSVVTACGYRRMARAAIAAMQAGD